MARVVHVAQANGRGCKASGGEADNSGTRFRLRNQGKRARKPGTLREGYPKLASNPGYPGNDAWVPAGWPSPSRKGPAQMSRADPAIVVPPVLGSVSELTDAYNYLKGRFIDIHSIQGDTGGGLVLDCVARDLPGGVGGMLPWRGNW